MKTITCSTVISILGSYLEKVQKKDEFYKSFTIDKFIQRLMINRPNAFMKGKVLSDKIEDTWLFEGKCGYTVGSGEYPLDWVSMSDEMIINFRENRITQENFISRIEMTIGSLLSMCHSCNFINNGSRFNSGNKESTGTYHPYGVYIGSVGARFEDPYAFAHTMCIISPNCNYENGYGEKRKRNNDSYLVDLLDSFAVGIDIPYFPTHEEILLKYTNSIQTGTLDEFKKYFEIIDDTNMVFFSKIIYKNIIYIPYYETIKYADRIGNINSKEVLLHLVGLGTGVWAKCPDVQNKIIKDVIYEILNNDITNINIVRLAWMGEIGTIKEIIRNDGNKIIILNTGPETEPLQPIPNDMERILIVQYAWDSGSFPGNEYYFFKHSVGGNYNKWKTSSGDPAAVLSTENYSLAETYKTSEYRMTMV